MRPAVQRTKILSQGKVGPGCFKLIVAAGGLRAAKPGQFVMVKIGQADQPLLRRPLSIHGADGHRLEFLYEAVGEGTRLLSRRKPGDYLDVIGPLGNGFNMPARHQRNKVILIAGGMGVAPLVFLAQKLKPGKGLVLIGARSARAILCEKDFQKAGFGVTIATDDGSGGFCGRVTALLEQQLSVLDYRPSVVYACGPHPMVREVARICTANSIPAQVSLEAHMACGIGACLGCAVLTRYGYQRVCKEGPVFDIEDVKW